MFSRYLENILPRTSTIDNFDYTGLNWAHDVSVFVQRNCEVQFARGHGSNENYKSRRNAFA